MKKQQFIKLIRALQVQNEKDTIYCRALGKVLHPYIEPYDNTVLVYAITDLLKKEFKDDHKESWIEYFCWELDFGKEYVPGTATEKDGSEIDLSSAGKLYDFLVKEKNLKTK